MSQSNFHSFYKYCLSDDDSECMKFLLYDFLLHWDIFKNDSGRRIQDFVFLLIVNGLSENETLNVIIESLFYIPRLDILYECSVPYDSYHPNGFGKLICNKRLLLFKLFNEFEESEFKKSINTLTNELCEDYSPTLNTNSILKSLNNILKFCKARPEAFRLFKMYFLNHGNNRTTNIINSFNEIEEITKCPSEQLWEKMAKDQKQIINENFCVALEKGDVKSNPNFVVSSKGRVELLTYKSSESYSFPENDPIKSFCLIFNIHNYEHYPRKGSDKDINNIRKTFEKLHFTIQLYENLTKKEMFETANRYSKIETNKSGSMLVCFILAHGSKDCIFDINEEKVSIREFSLIFSAKNSEAYQNKPKVFFIQACQGDRFHEGIPETGNVLESSQFSLLPAQSDSISQPKIKEYKQSEMIPEEADFIYGMATASDYVAFRSTKNGSWYITELCKRINQEAKKLYYVYILCKYALNVKSFRLIIFVKRIFK